MQPKSEEFLNLLLWSAEKLMRPTYRNLTESYESWAYRQGFFRQLGRLEKQRLVERFAGGPNERLYRLTTQGRLHALGGRDPEERWARAWDGRWRLVLFDVPTVQNDLRDRLRHLLRIQGFGCLQRSVWITPDPLTGLGPLLAGAKVNAKSLLLLEALPCAGESDPEIVAGAWDFEEINRRHARHLEVLGKRPELALRTAAGAGALQRWAMAEREAWLDAVTNDPLLPSQILPPGYLGQQAWKRRVEVLAEARQQLPTFRPQ